MAISCESRLNILKNFNIYFFNITELINGYHNTSEINTYIRMNKENTKE